MDRWRKKINQLLLSCFSAESHLRYVRLSAALYSREFYFGGNMCKEKHLEKNLRGKNRPKHGMSE